MKKKKPAVHLTTKIWDYCFTPPYCGVPWLVWLYAFVSIFIYLHATGPMTGHLIGFDDHVRMFQVLNLVNGADWYDRTIMRANLPEGFHTVWPRIVDIPIALTVLLAQQFTDQKTAALIASIVVPFAELAILFITATYFARPLVGKNHARLMALFLMFTTVLNQKKFTIAGFHAGQASHHSWYIILNVLMFGAVTRVALNVAGRAPALMTGAAIALLLAVGIEGFPMVAGAAAIFAVLAWVFLDAPMARRGAEAIGWGALFSLVLLPLNQPPAHLFEISFAEPSILGPILVGAAALFLILESLVLTRIKQPKIVSLIILVLLTGILGASLIAAFPQILEGPGAALSPAERNMAFHQHPEVWSLYHIASTPLEYVGLIMPILIAFTASLFALRSTTNRRRRILYASYLGSMCVAGGMGQVFWRYYHHALMTTCAWLLWAWQKIKQRIRKNIYFSLLSLALFIALGPFWMLFLPAMEVDAPFLTQIVFFPAKVYGPWDSCDIRGIATYINEHYSKDKVLIVPENDSAKFLYHTNVIIDFLANYPSQDKFIENESFFQSNDPRITETVARNHQIDLVAICPFLPLSPEALQTRSQRIPMFMELLAEQTPPPWLKQVNAASPNNYLLFEVDKSLLNGKKRQ